MLRFVLVSRAFQLDGGAPGWELDGKGNVVTASIMGCHGDSLINGTQIESLGEA